MIKTRNRTVPVLLFKSGAGIHDKTTKAKRKKEKQQFVANIKRGLYLGTERLLNTALVFWRGHWKRK